jgi:hypothetical protein
MAAPSEADFWAKPLGQKMLLFINHIIPSILPFRFHYLAR